MTDALEADHRLFLVTFRLSTDASARSVDAALQRTTLMATAVGAGRTVEVLVAVWAADPEAAVSAVSTDVLRCTSGLLSSVTVVAAR